MAGRTKDYHKKLYRLVRILNRLETERKISPRELAEEFNVSMRTAQRDIELINMAEFPLVSMEKGVYSFVPGFSLKRLPLTNEEASLLAFLCEVAQSMGGSFTKSFRNLFSKATLSADGDSPFHAILPIGTKEKCPAMPDLLSAVEEHQKVEITYANGRAHLLHPLKIIYSEGFWYLIGRMEGHADFKTFRIDRIKSVKLLDQWFEPPKNLTGMLRQTRNIWFGPKADMRVVLRVATEVASYFQSASYLPQQKILKTLRGGAVLVETRISHFMEVIPTILKWIPYITVVRPKALKTEIKGMVREYLRGF